MKFRICDLCGTKLERDEMIFNIKDARDPYIKYHSKYWSVCDDCYEELENRRKKVWEKINKEQQGNCGCGNDDDCGCTHWECPDKPTEDEPSKDDPSGCDCEDLGMIEF